MQVLAQVVNAYQQVLDEVKQKLAQLGYRPTTRVKTTGTLIDKLRRETARLSQVQDLAGARIVVGDRRAQDETSEAICKSFEAKGSVCKVIDRRLRPSYGYRAVHVIVYWGGVPVEIQIRTELQDIWAQIVERLGDRWGRGLRYGEDPEDPDALVAGEGTKLPATRRKTIEMVGNLGDSIAALEEARVNYAAVSERLEQLRRMMAAVAPQVADDERPVGEYITPAAAEAMDGFVAISPDEQARALIAGWRDMTLHDLAEAFHPWPGMVRAHYDESLRLAEETMHRELRVIAAATERA